MKNISDLYKYHYVKASSKRGARKTMSSTSSNANRTFRVSGYQVIRIIGTGAKSTIWEVRQETTGQSFALKRVIKQNNDDDRFANQIINEFECGQHIDHPNIRKVYDLRKIRKFISVREIQLLMEYCPGRSVQDAPPKSILDACSIFTQVAAAMDDFNKAGFVHADMKPNNIVVLPDGNVKIIDLGQACRIGTVKERIQGTPDFIAPEQVNRWPLDARTDVFNFGAAFYWALTGKCIPTLLPTLNAMRTSSRGATVIPPNEHNRDIPTMLSNLVLDCVQVEPKHRPETMREIVRRLGIILKREFQPVP